MEAVEREVITAGEFSCYSPRPEARRMRRNQESGEERECGDKKKRKQEYIRILEVGIVRRRPAPVKKALGRTPDQRERGIGKDARNGRNRELAGRDTYISKSGACIVCDAGLPLLPGSCPATMVERVCRGKKRKKRGNSAMLSEDVDEQRGRLKYPARRMFSYKQSFSFRY